jgi:membrane associated rhomboid family serine protease
MLRRGDTVFTPVTEEGGERRRFAWMVAALVAANGLAWLLQLEEGEPLTNALAAIPYELTTGTDVVDTQWVATPDRFVPIEHQRGPSPIHLTLVSSMFLHGSWAHLLGNMLYLCLFGAPIERRTGPLRFFAFYLTCGLVAGVAHVLAGPESMIPTVGASGAISGIMGAYVLTFPLREVPVIVRLMTFGWVTPKLPAVAVFGFWLLLQWLGYLTERPGNAGGVAFMAHIGGFIAGLVLAAFLVPNEPPPPERRRIHEEISY